MEEPICPKCQSREFSWFGYSCPAQVICAKCGIHYEYGKIQNLSIIEGIIRRPQLYKSYLCSECGKYDIPAPLIDESDLTEDIDSILCKCRKSDQGSDN